jgi:hypothetical protein
MLHFLSCVYNNFAKRLYVRQVYAKQFLLACSFLPCFGLFGFTYDLYAIQSTYKNSQSFLREALHDALGQRHMTGLSVSDMASFMDNSFLERQETDEHSMEGLHLTQTENGYSAKARVVMKPTLLNLVGIPLIELDIEADYSTSILPTDLTLIIDTSSPLTRMLQWQAPRQALETMLSTIKHHSPDIGFRASLIPVSDRVNIGPERSDWLSGLDTHDPTDWNGCVRPREEVLGAYPYILTSRTPDDLLFMPASYKDHVFPLACPEPILVHASSLQPVLDTIDAISIQGTGRFDQGLAWGWRTLSPQWSAFWSPENIDAHYASRKIAVFITDGHSEIYRYEAGGVAGDILGYNRGSRSAFRHLFKICNMMKRDNIVLHIVFLKGNDAAEKTLRNCATSRDHFHMVLTERHLVDALQRIGVVSIRNSELVSY